MGFLAGKRALIVGLATERSIAYGIAQAMRREGAELAFSYQERFKDRVEAMAAEFGAGDVFEMDVASDDSIDAAFATLGKKLGRPRHRRARGRVRPERCDSRRLRRVHDARELPHRARHLQLQPHCAREGRRADAAAVAPAHCSR